VLADQGAAAADRRRPWIQHIGKGYELMGRVELVERFRTVRAATLTLVEGLQAQDWMRRGSVGGTANSVLDLGTWLANHDVGHLAQARRPGPASGRPS
jgi:DinB superfamily